MTPQEAIKILSTGGYGKTPEEFDDAVSAIDALIEKYEQMMKEAKDGYVSGIIIHNDGDEAHYAVTYPIGERPHSITDKVKIIIL